MVIHIKNVILGGLLAFLLVACGTGGGPNIRPDNNQNKIRGISLYQQEDYFLAVNELMQAHQQLPNDTEVFVALLDSWLQMGESVRVWQLLNQSSLKTSEVYLVESLLLKQQETCEQVLLQLNNVQHLELNQQWLSRYLKLKAECQQETDQYFSAAMSFIELSKMLDDHVEIQNVHDAIVRNLIAVQEETLILAIGEESDLLKQGWIEAAYLKFGADGVSGSGWLTQWQDHPASVYFLDMNQSTGRQKVAVILPFSGRYGAVAKAVQKGLLAAATSDLAGNNELVFFDSGSQGENVSSAFYSAQETRANLIIGPLDKASIETFESMPEPTVPVVLLNQSESNHLQFTLSPEGEAETAADKMIADGLKNVLILAPNEEWGERMTKAFAQRFVDRGGHIQNNAYFQAQQNDFSAQLRQILGLVESQLRARNLQQFVGVKINSDEVVRSDIDAIFLAAKPDFARLMIPQLKFHRAADIPVYTTSHVFDGLDNEQHNRDLDGVRFAVSPIELETSQLVEILPFSMKNIKSDKRLFAFGFDAYQLISRLAWMSRMNTGMVDGLTGKIRIGFDSKFSRELLWAQYLNGSIVPLAQ